MKRIKQVSVKNLFGMFDHTISLHLDERITIIYGPNGVGKTAILRLLDCLFSVDNSALESVPFDEFRVDFDDNTYIWVKECETLSGLSDEYRDLFDDTRPPYIVLHFFDPTKGVAISYPIINSAWSAQAWPPIEDVKSYETLDNESFYELRKSLSLRFIETQRLQNSSYSLGTGMGSTVAIYTRELIAVIEETLAESTTLAQSLDRTFPRRVINLTAQKLKITENELRERLEELEGKRKYLMATGLLYQEDDDTEQIQEQDQINESTKVVLSIYAEDTEKKLSIFDELANKIDLLKRIINKRFLYKEMTISREQGFVFTNMQGVELSPTDLSSGEQHELILFYELLFKVAPGTLILIDEPEISLHVVWQEQFLEDVQAVTRLSDIDVLLATHSPDIIAGRRDLVVELKGPM